MNDLNDLLLYGYHVYEREEDVPFEFQWGLGQGNSGVVQQVKGKGRGWADKVFARKSMTVAGGRHSKDQILNEVRVIQRLSHRQITKALFLYQLNLSYNLIMQPVAGCDLSALLQNPKEDEGSRDTARGLKFLKRVPGCLLNAIHHIHESGIIHGSLHARNILVHGRNVLIADFGRVTEIAHSPGPNARGDDLSHRAAEIFNLGRIFLKIATLLFGLDLMKLEEFFASSGAGSSSYLQWIWVLWKTWSPHTQDSSVVNSTAGPLSRLCFFMLEPSFRIRITSTQLLHLIAMEEQEDEGYPPLPGGGCSDCTKSWEGYIASDEPTYASFKPACEAAERTLFGVMGPRIEFLDQTAVESITWEDAKRRNLRRHIHWD